MEGKVLTTLEDSWGQGGSGDARGARDGDGGRAFLGHCHWGQHHGLEGRDGEARRIPLHKAFLGVNDTAFGEKDYITSTAAGFGGRAGDLTKKKNKWFSLVHLSVY
jgi:hypothetical protein